MNALLISILLVFPLFVFGQANKNSLGIIRGTVLTADGQAASNVSVLIKNTGKGTITDVNGNFELRNINPGIYFLSISLSGYRDSTIAVDIKQHDELFYKIQIRRTYAALQTVVVSEDLHPNYIETKPSESLHLDLPLNEIPQNIAVTSKQLLYDQGLLSVGEAIRTVSGVEKQYAGLNDYALIIRGTDATWNIFRNGVGGYWWNQQEDVAMIEKIEFIKGPAGFMVSLAQPGGIVNVVTKQPTKERIANINAGFGSYHMMRIATDFGGPLTKNAKLSYRLNAGLQNQERAFQLSKAYRYFVCAALNYEASKKTSVTAEYNYMKGVSSGNNTDLPSINGKMFSLARNFVVADASTDKLTAIDNYYRIQVTHSFNDNWHFYAQVAYVHGSWGGYMLNADIDVPVSNDTLYRASNFADWRNSSKVAQAYFDGKIMTGRKIEHQILIGIDYCDALIMGAPGGTWGENKFGLNLLKPQYYVSPDSLKNFPTGAPTRLGWGWTALYLQDNIKIATKLVVTLAGHLTHAPVNFDDPSVPDYQTNTHYNVFTPRAGLTWLFSPHVSVYALYDQCFWPQEKQNFQHKPFSPLTGYDIETGIKSFFFNNRLSLNLSVYNIVKNNTLTPDPLHNGDYIQKGQITSKGVDFDLTGNLTPSLIINANYAFTDAKITKDSDPNMIGLKNLGVPDNNCNLWLKYNPVRGKLKNMAFGIGYQYMGNRSAALNWVPGDEIKFLPIYHLLDAALSYRNEKFYVSLNVYNITDINYAAVGYFNSSTNEWRYTPGELVNFRLSFGVNLLH